MRKQTVLSTPRFHLKTDQRGPRSRMDTSKQILWFWLEFGLPEFAVCSNKKVHARSLWNTVTCPKDVICLVRYFVLLLKSWNENYFRSYLVFINFISLTVVQFSSSCPETSPRPCFVGPVNGIIYRKGYRNLALSCTPLKLFRLEVDMNCQFFSDWILAGNYFRSLCSLWTFLQPNGGRTKLFMIPFFKLQFLWPTFLSKNETLATKPDLLYRYSKSATFHIQWNWRKTQASTRKVICWSSSAYETSCQRAFYL